jgi:nucleotide-binding universal stress UspA family protein
MYRAILVLLDGSAFGEQALPRALSIARRAGATMRLAHVHTDAVVHTADVPVLLKRPYVTAV